MATGALAQLLTPAAGARTVSSELEDLEETEDEDQNEDQDEDQDEGEEESEDSGNRLGQRKDEITPDPTLIADHDNGNHNGLVNQPDDKPLRGVGYWANLTGAKSKQKSKK
jgi:hypothetical protein